MRLVFLEVLRTEASQGSDLAESSLTGENLKFTCGPGLYLEKVAKMLD